jgi:hypothetical protein
VNRNAYRSPTLAPLAALRASNMPDIPAAARLPGTPIAPE